MLNDGKELDYIPQPIGEIAAAASVRERELCAGRAANDDIDVLGEALKWQGSDIHCFGGMPVIELIGSIGGLPSLIGRHDVDFGQGKPQRPPSDTRVEIDCSKSLPVQCNPSPMVKPG
jgi:hypothetical protein